MSDSLDPSKLKLAELRAELQARGLDSKGNKPVLVERLREGFEQANDEEEADAGDLELEPDHDEQEGEEEEDPEAPDPDSVHENKPVLELEPEREFEHEAERDEPALELEPEGDLDAESQPEPEPEPEHHSEPESRAKSASPPREDEPSQKGMSSYSSPHKDGESSEEKEFDLSHRQHARDNTTAKGEDIAVKEEVEDEYYKMGYEDAPMQDISEVKEELGNGYDGSMKIEEIDIKEELIEPMQEPSDTEDRQGEKRRAHSRSCSPDSKKQRPEVEEVRVEYEPEYDKSALSLDRGRCAMAQERREEAHCNSRLTSQSRRIILNVYNHYRNQDQRESEMDVERKTAAATGISVRTLQRIKRQHREHGIKSPPCRTRISPVLGAVNNFDKECLRRVILSFYERGEIPTIESVLEKVKEPPISFPGAQTSLRLLVRQLGFRYKKVRSGRFMLMEREDIVVARNKYLRILNENRNSSSSKQEIYLGETWINQNDCVSKCWTIADGSKGPKLKTGKGDTFIILHAGGRDGFIPGALLFFTSKNGNKGDCHDSMNYMCFHDWFQTQLLPNIPAHSLIIMDNASYHSKMLNKAPTSSSKKCEIIQWLTENSINHDPSHNKHELLDLVKVNRCKQVYAIDKIASEAGHQILRLPPYHCQLNPIELIWAQMKTEVKKNNSHGNQTLKKVEVARTAINSVTIEDWRKCIHHTREVEDEYRRKDRAFDHLLESFITDINDDSSEFDGDE
ncbi:uncharacterized protein [Macrobrachium rosenbergii]|uniref:uncharacterized protein isoform X5 n=1 Tax=Macrobrachium rosenbergii TaxID=79674 RepID=UPI0034D3B657